MGLFLRFFVSNRLRPAARRNAGLQTRLRNPARPLIMIRECAAARRSGAIRLGRERMQRTLRLLAIVAGLCVTTEAFAQKYPVRPVKINTVADLVAAAKAAPGALAYGSGGNGNLAHLAMELLSERAGVKMIHVPYRGGAASEVGILAQEVLAVFDPLSAVPLVKAGKLRALAVSSAERLPALPDVPTVAEAGYPGFDI